MAYYTPNNNAGIPTLDLTEFGLTQPQENMQVAEAFNYNTLPQAREKFEPDFGGMLDATQNLGKNYKGTTRGDFMDAIKSGAFNAGGREMFNRNRDAVFEGVNLDAGGLNPFSNVTPTYNTTTDGSFRGNIDIDKGALSDDALQSLPKGFFQNVGDQSSLIGPGGYPMTAMATDLNRMTDAGYMGFGLNNTGTTKEDDLMNYDEFYDMPEEEKKDGIFESLKGKINPADLLSFLTNVYTGGTKQALTGAGIGKAFGNVRDAIGNRLGPSPYGTSQAAFNAMTPSQQQAVGSIYGQGGIMQGYNAVSAFGRGPAGAIQNRIDNILGRKAAQTAISRQRVKDLQAALTNVGGGDSGGGGGYSQSSVDAGVQAAEDDR